MLDNYNLDTAIRKVESFPKEGIVFYDITSILSNPEAFSYCISHMVKLYKDRPINGIVAVEARGFLFAAPVAEKLGIPLILARKKGKLPGKVIEKSFALEYGEDVIQIQKNDIKIGDNILLIDDLVATGGTLKATAELIEESGAIIEEICCIIGLPFLNNFEPLNKYKLSTLINYHGESM
ncbi:MAG: adenine phosphoribosyltransferase [Spirochaetia bacterium]|jgi:adenine phosphoribosyltransferase|nr:adenine phosphoribosyltransferase [Spirochaetia bacterium]